MRKPSFWALSAALVGIGATAAAAPKVGEPFFVADPRTSGDAVSSVASGSQGFVVGWAAEGEAAEQRLARDGTLVGAPVVVAQPGDVTRLGVHGGTRAQGHVEVVSATSGSFFAYGEYSRILYAGAGDYTLFGAAGVLVPLAGSPSSPVGLDSRNVLGGPFALASTGAGWAAARWSVPPIADGMLELTLTLIAPDGTVAARPWIQTYLAPFGNLPVQVGGIGLASDGSAYLAAWVEGAALRLALATPTGEVTPLDSPAGWKSSGPVRAASNGTGYVVAWVDDAGALRAGRVASDGTVLDTTGILVAGNAHDVHDVEPAGSDYLLAFRTSGADGGSSLRAARLTASGTVPDPDGFDVGAGGPGALAAVSDGVWLLVYADDGITDRTLLRGRFIGASSVPPAPTNPVPPPSPRAEAGSAAPDAAVPVFPGPSTPDVTGDAGAPESTSALDGSSGARAASGDDTARSAVGGASGCSIDARSLDRGGHTVLVLAALGLTRRRRSAVVGTRWRIALKISVFTR